MASFAPIHDDIHQVPPSHHDSHNAQQEPHPPPQYFDFTGGTGPHNQVSFVSGPAPLSHSGVIDYKPARPPPLPPPHEISLSQQQSSYGETAYPFKGPLTIYYGFKPVATPYGNISVGKQYGSSFKRYDTAISLALDNNDQDHYYGHVDNNFIHEGINYNDQTNEQQHDQHLQQLERDRQHEQHDFSHPDHTNHYNNFNDNSHQHATATSITAGNDLHSLMQHVLHDHTPYADYPDFNDDENDLPSSSSNYDSDLDSNAYRNVRYKRDVNFVRWIYQFYFY